MTTFKERISALSNEELSVLFGPVNGEPGIVLSTQEREALATLVGTGMGAEKSLKELGRTGRQISQNGPELQGTLDLPRQDQELALEDLMAETRGNMRELLVGVCVRSHLVDPVATEVDISRRIPTFEFESNLVAGRVGGRN